MQSKFISSCAVLLGGAALLSAACSSTSKAPPTESAAPHASASAPAATSSASAAAAKPTAAAATTASAVPAAPPTSTPEEPAVDPASAPTLSQGNPAAGANVPRGRSQANVPPALAPIGETQVVIAPAPTLSPTFGLRVAAANGQFLVTGPVRALVAGDAGQIANFTLQDGLWTVNKEMAQVQGLQPRDLTLQRIACGGNMLLTVLERFGGLPQTVAVLEPNGSNWKQTTLLPTPRALQRPGYGGAIATDGRFVAVSAVDLRFAVDKPAPLAGPEVFIFQRLPNAWQVDGTVMLPPEEHKTRTGLWFGASVAVSDGTLVVGNPMLLPVRPHEVFPASGEASVIVFKRGATEWQEQQEIKGATVTSMPGFGNQVSIEGDLMTVRAANVTADRSPSKVWLFRRSNDKWSLVNELLPAPGLIPGTSFGASIVISKGRVVLADPSAHASNETPATAMGMVLVFEERDGAWVNTMRLQPTEPSGPSQFGQDIAAMWPWVAVNRLKNDRAGVKDGGAYLFKLGQ